jgi:hypothetical protein
LKIQDIYYYKPALFETIERYKALYQTDSPGHACVFLGMPYQGEPMETMPLNQIDWSSEHGFDEYLDLTLRNSIRSWENAREFADDNIPTAALFIGIGEYSSFVAGDVVFTEDTSWAQPILQTWDDLSHLELNPENRWVKTLEHAMDYLCDRCRPAGIPVLRGYYSPLDLAHALAGNRILTDCYDNPEQVHRLMSFCTDAAIWLADRIQSITGEWYGGVVAGAWLPPKTICMSEDIACLVSPRIYREFARPYTQKVIDHFGSGQIHTHSLGLRVIPEISKLDKLVGIQIAEDPNTPRAFENIDFLLDRCGRVPLSVSCTLSELESKLPEIMQKSNFIACPVLDSREECNKALNLVRSLSII